MQQSSHEYCFNVGGSHYPDLETEYKFSLAQEGAADRMNVFGFSPSEPLKGSIAGRKETEVEMLL